MLGCSGLCMRPGQDAWRVKYEVVVENRTHGHGRRVVSSRAGKSALNDDGDGEVACVPGWPSSWIFVCLVQTRSSPKHRRAGGVERETWSRGQEAKKEIREGRDAEVMLSVMVLIFFDVLVYSVQIARAWQLRPVPRRAAALKLDRQQNSPPTPLTNYSPPPLVASRASSALPVFANCATPSTTWAQRLGIEDQPAFDEQKRFYSSSFACRGQGHSRARMNARLARAVPG
ncbi:uncharacterized protein J3D65DRAFT_278605 [Phyllosticta citribraziliensis]|uniref:Uncharacterized protein n=1 Tax=Phyllosticta citribraziliensis TaxID=989973 RepID=A0ABR1LZB3_9PEZI